jgi:hypothetical protein
MRKWVFGLVGVAALVAAAPAQDKQDKAAVEVIKKAIDAHGGADALNKYKAGAMKMKGTAAVMGIDLEFVGTVAYAFPDKFKMTFDADLMGQKLAMVQVANGENVKTTMNGMAIPLPDAAKNELMAAATEQEVGMLTPLLDAEKYTLKSGGEAEVGTKKANVVIVSGKRLKDKEWKLFFDKDKGTMVQLKKKGLSPDGQTEVDEETLYEDYKKVDGVLTAHKFTVKHDGNKYLTFEVSDVKYKEKGDDKEFAIDD